MSVTFSSPGMGQKLYVSASAANIRLEPSTTSDIVGKATKDSELIRTGYLFSKPNEYQWYEIKYGNVKGWVRSDVIVNVKGAVKAEAKPVATNSEDGKTILANILRNDKYTYHNLSIAQGFIQDNPNASQSLKDRYIAIFNSWNQRQTKIKDSEYLTTTQSTVREGLDWLKKLVGISGTRIGAIPLVAALPYVAMAAVGAGAGYLVYIIFKDDEPKSFSDFKGSEELVKKLYAELPKDKVEEIIEMVKETTEDAYKQGKSDGGGLSSQLKNYGIFAALAAGTYLIASRKNKNKNG